MNNKRSQMMSPYMEFAKLRSDAKYNLATSGMMSYPLAELPVRLEDLEINGVNPYGYAPLIERLAKYNGVPAECVVTSAGTSLANHLAMAATFDPGDEVLIEHPTYELLESTAEYLGAKLRRFERRLEDDFRIDPAEVERQITPQTKLVMLTNLHNPTGAYADEATIRAVGEIAKARGARVLVDEVYLETFYGHRPRTAFHAGRAVSGHQQPDQGIWVERDSVRVGTGERGAARIACGGLTICIRRRQCIPRSDWSGGVRRSRARLRHARRGNSGDEPAAAGGVSRRAAGSRSFSSGAWDDRVSETSCGKCGGVHRVVAREVRDQRGPGKFLRHAAAFSRWHWRGARR